MGGKTPTTERQLLAKHSLSRQARYLLDDLYEVVISVMIVVDLGVVAKSRIYDLSLPRHASFIA